MNTYKFYKNGNNWYIDLPAFIEQGGSMADLQMVEGADRLLDIIANEREEVLIEISGDMFENAEQMYLTEMCDPVIGGGYYLIPTYKQETVNLTVWLYHVTEHVFGYLPHIIFFKEHNTNP